MTPEQVSQVEDLFHRGKDLSPEQQCALLDAECSRDSAVRDEIENLLTQADPDQTLADLKSKVNQALQHGADNPSAATAGPVIEGYEILGEIHRGGQGVVYQAIQKSTKRKVAIKVLLAGPYASKPARKRFEREIELVAQLKHPNIISIFHSGQTSDDQRYCVMDYVRGVPLDQYVRNEKLTLEGALKLFAKVCEAVNYAHQKGVIHRDLKPSNILVTPPLSEGGAGGGGGVGEPKVLDFGLAKQLVSRDASLISLTGQVVGTLPYMSPEQAEGNPDKVDIRTDVYSLGMTLYHLLTGEYAYPVDGHVGDVLQHIIQTAPRKPSLLRPELNRDIDTIVLKALAKEKDRRYPSAGALASDIARFLAGKPIQARRDHLLYVAAKQATRWTAHNERTALALAAVASVVLALGVGTPLVFQWTPANQWYERAAVTGLTAAESKSAFDHVRVIAITDETDFEELARTQRLEGVRADKAKSWRRLHGRLMQRLVQAGARVVVWDIAFRGETPFDKDFVLGVKALDQAGVPVVTGVRGGWWFDESSLPEQSRVIAPHVHWGCLNADFGPRAPWRVPLAGQRGRNRPLPSLSLAAMALWRHPDAQFAITIDRAREQATIQYTRLRPELPQAPVILAGDDTIPMRVQAEKDDLPEFGLKTGDVVGLLTVPMPPDPFLARSTIEYASIFGAADDKLQEWFKDRVVVVGNKRPGVDRHLHPDGREIWGCYGQASAIKTAIKIVLDDVHRPTKLSGATLRVSVLSGSALFGLIVGLTTARLRLRRYLALTVCAAAWALVSVLLAAGFQWIWNPMVPFLALLLSCELCSAVHRVRLRRTSWNT